jgi:LPXTG-motif cell wall-anchored protein
MRQTSEKAHQKMLQAMIEKDEHFKLYKAGKVWLIAGLATFSFAVAPQVVHADTTDTVAQTAVDQSTTASQTTTTEAAAASTATSVATTSSAVTSNATDTDTVASSANVKSQAASDAASSTAPTNIAASSAAVPASSAAPASEATVQNVTASPSIAASASKPTATSNATAREATNSTAPISTASAVQTASTTDPTTAVAAPASAEPATNTTVSTGTAVTAGTTIPASTVEQVTAELPTGAVVNTLNGGLVVTLPVGTDIDVVKQRLSASNLTVPVTLNAAAAEATISDASHKVNVTLSTDTIGYNSGANTLTVGLHMTFVAGDTLTMTFPTNSPIINWIGYEALPTGVGNTSVTNNDDGTTTYTILVNQNNGQISQDISLNLLDNLHTKTILADNIGTTTQQITWSVNGVTQTPITLTQTISPKITLSAPQRTHPDVASIPKVNTNVNYVYSFNLGESSGALDDKTSGAVLKALNTGGATVTIPVPTGFLLDEAATASNNRWNSMSITQPGGVGTDVIISVAANSGSTVTDNNTVPGYTLVGQYQLTQPNEDTTLTANGPITFTQILNDGSVLSATGPTWSEELLGGHGNSIDMSMDIKGNSSAVPQELALDSDPNDDPAILSGMSFSLNSSEATSDGSFVLTIPDGINATGISVPTEGITSSSYLPGTTSYTYVLTLADGTTENGTVAAGATITPTASSAIRKAVLTPDTLVGGAYIGGDNQFSILGNLASAYDDGTAVANGDTLTFDYAYRNVENTWSANIKEAVAEAKAHAILYKWQRHSTPGSDGYAALQLAGNNGQTTQSIYEPILYFVIPKSASIVGYDFDKHDYHPVITTYTTNDGRTGVKMDFTGTGEYLITDGATKVNLINALDATTGTEHVLAFMTSPTTLLVNSEKVTDVDLTNGDANAWVMGTDQSTDNWNITVAEVASSVTLAKGNQNPDFVTAATADERGDTALSFVYNLVNGTQTALTSASAILNLPTVGDALGSSFNYNLTGPITIPAVSSVNGTPITATVSYSTNLYSADATSSAPDLTGFVSESAIKDWSTVRSVYIAFDSVPGLDSTGRVLLTGTANDFLAQGNTVGYLGSYSYNDGAPVNIATTKTASKVTISGISTISARAHYVDGNGQDQYIALDDLTRTLTDNKDTLANDYPATVADFSEADQALLPAGYSLTDTTIVNSAATYPDGMANGTAVIGNVSQYDFDGDIVQFELTRDQPTKATNIISKTVHYVDEAGQAIADNYVDAVTITQITDKAADTVTYEPSQDVLGHQDNPTIKGYTVQTSPAEATSDQSVTFGSDNIDLTVVYTKNKAVEDTQTITKTVHYQLADGTPLRDDYIAKVELKKSTDAVTDEVTYSPETATLAGNPNPTIDGYHIVTADTTTATSTQTVKYGDGDIVATVTYEKDAPAVAAQIITKTVHYRLADGTKLADDYTASVELKKSTDAVTGAVTYEPEMATLAGHANEVIKGYHVVTASDEATSDQTVKYGDNNIEDTVVYAEDTPKMNLDTVTKTVHYVDQAGQSIAPDFVSHVNFTEIVDPVTGKSSYGPESASLAGQTDPTIAGYHVVQDDTAAAATQTVQFGDADLEYRVVYNKDTPAMSLDTVTKTVHYVDQAGNTIAPDYVSQANITRSTDPVTGQYAYGPATATVGSQTNPTITGYHVVNSPAAATRTATIVYFGDADLDYTVVYNKDTPAMNLDTVTKIVHYVDQAGNTLAPDYVSTANITEITDPVTGEKTYGPVEATVDGQKNPEITGYHVVTNPVGANTDETVHFGDADLDYTVVYNKDTPAMNLDTVTKTVHYVDQAGNTLAPDYKDHVNFTEVIDPVTGAKSYSPTEAIVGGQANLTITGYHVVNSPTTATLMQTVHFGDADLIDTVVYGKDTPAMMVDTITKTVHYVDQAGNTLAPDYVSQANITRLTDTATGEYSYGPATATVAGKANPAIVGYHVVTNPIGATRTVTIVYFGDADLNYTVVYNKDTPAMNLDTITKTVHYVDQDGRTLASDFISTANITEVVDPVTGEKTYGPTEVMVGSQKNPIIAGYHVVTNPVGASTDEAVQFGDADHEYTVVYNKDIPTMDLDTVTKTVHYVNQAGNTLAPDYVSQANITRLTDASTGEYSYGPATATVAGQDNPVIAGYHVVTNPVGATRTATIVYFGDANLDYTVIYAANPDTDDNGTPENNGGTTTPGNNGGTTTPENNGDTTTPGNNGGTTTPGNNGGTTTPGNNGGTTTPGNNGGTTTPGNNGGTTTPGNNGGTTTPGNNGGTTTPGNNGGTTMPGNNGGTTTPGNNGGTTTPGNNGGTTTPGNNGGTATPGNNGGTTPGNNGGTTTPENNGDTTTPSNNGGITTSDNNDDTTVPAQPSAAATVTTGNSTVTPNPTAATMATASNEKTAQSSNTDAAASGTGTKATTLPQTGDETQPQLALLGASMLALLGLVGYRRKRD